MTLIILHVFELLVKNIYNFTNFIIHETREIRDSRASYLLEFYH